MVDPLSMLNLLCLLSRSCTVFLVLVFVVVLVFPVLGWAGTPQSDPGTNAWRLFAGVGYLSSGKTSFVDADCAATQPPAYFGCGAGSDGRRRGAYGDFGTGVSLEVGAGWSLSTLLAAEIAAAYRPGLKFSGNANFDHIAAADQPVHSDAATTSVMFSLALKLPHSYTFARSIFRGAAVQPYLSAGVGAAYNQIEHMRYRFPTLDNNGDEAATYTNDGGQYQFAWQAGLGVWLHTRQRSWSVELRYLDMGEARTNAGEIDIVRPGRRLAIGVGETSADLVARELVVRLVL